MFVVFSRRLTSDPADDTAMWFVRLFSRCLIVVSLTMLVTASALRVPTQLTLDVLTLVCPSVVATS